MNTDDTDRGHRGSKDTPALEGRHRQDRGAAAFSRQSDSTHTRPPHTPQKEKQMKKEKFRSKKQKIQIFLHTEWELPLTTTAYFDKYWEQSLKKISQIKIWNNCSSANNYSMETVKQYKIGW